MSEYSFTTHQRSALVHLALLEGFKYLLCEVVDEDRDFEWIDSLDIAIIVDFGIYHEGSRLVFIDIDGNEHNAAQIINNDGTVMGYKTYLELKKLNKLRSN